MPDSIIVSGLDSGTLLEALNMSCRSKRPTAVGLASAFVSVAGVEHARQIFRHSRSLRCRLVAGLDNAITHPEALAMAQRANWEVRVLRGSVGIFHSKVIIAGDRFLRAGTVRNPTLAYVGSSNLTAGGLRTNIECGLLADNQALAVEASIAFSHFWRIAQPINETLLRNYAAAFADRNRRRSPEELDALGIADKGVRYPRSRSTLLRERPPYHSSIPSGFAAAAWAGLQSFTGEYRFQIEFPRAAGEVVNRLVAGRSLPNGAVEVFSSGDETTYPMQYRFYTDNDMFRLNVPNEVAGVQWAREHRDGLALIEPGPTGGAPIRLTLLRPGTKADEIVARSVALGTWGRTSTRLYGWF